MANFFKSYFLKAFFRKTNTPRLAPKQYVAEDRNSNGWNQESPQRPFPLMSLIKWC